MSRAQDIMDEIAGSERFARMLSDRVYVDEPILSTGREMLRRTAERPAADKARTSAPEPTPQAQEPTAPMAWGTGSLLDAMEPQVSAAGTRRPAQRPAPVRLPAALQRLRRLEREQVAWGYQGFGAKLFFEQAMLCADFTCDYEGDLSAPASWELMAAVYPSYRGMSDEELLRYFAWRTRLRAGEAPECPSAFLFVAAYELLIGVGYGSDEEGLGALSRLAESYRGVSGPFDARVGRWLYDYAIYHGLDMSTVTKSGSSARNAAVSCLRRAESALIERDARDGWPDRGGASWGLPEEGELLDALCTLSRYRAERSRLVRSERDDVARVCARVFARMVDHCHRRRKNDYVDGLFGGPVRVSYLMFPQALFWSETRHEDTQVTVGEGESFSCERGVWWHVLPCRRQDTSRELGDLLHTIDARMRQQLKDPHPLKERTIPKYQARFVDEEIARLMSERAAREAMRIEVDRRTLESIRNSASRVREALLTDEERDVDEPARIDEVLTTVVHEVVLPAASAGAGAVGSSAPPTPPTSPATGALGLTAAQCELLRALLEGRAVPESGSGSFLSLEVDSINEAFLDVVGDTVLEYVDGEPCLVEDYADEVAEALAQDMA